MEVCIRCNRPVVGTIVRVFIFSSYIVCYRPRCVQTINRRGDLCKKFFTTKKGLLKHIEDIHRNRRGWDCDECDTTCASKYALKTHKEEQHCDNPAGKYYRPLRRLFVRSMVLSACQQYNRPTWFQSVFRASTTVATLRKRSDT